MSHKKIGIVGAGIVGLSTAFRLIEEFSNEQISIDIIAEKFYNETTSFGAGGLWEPYQIAGTPDEVVNAWGKYAFDHFLDLLYSTEGNETGVQLLTAYSLLEKGQDLSPPSWSDIVFNFKCLTAEEIQRMHLPTKYIGGYTFGTVVVEQKYYMRYITQKLAKFGVKFIQNRIESIDNLVDTANYDIVVNCSGLGAYHLNNDNTMYPIRGQVLRVKAPWMNNVWFFGTSYIIPNVDSVVLGGTTQKDNWNTNVSLDDTETIISNISEVFPSIRNAPIVSIFFSFSLLI